MLNKQQLNMKTGLEKRLEKTSRGDIFVSIGMKKCETTFSKRLENLSPCDKFVSTGHLQKCSRYDYGFCIGIKKNGFYCGNKEKLSLQSCNYGEGAFCPTHYKKNLGLNHDFELSRCANIRCDELNLSLAERNKINQHNIENILNLPGSKKYDHISITRQKYFARNNVPEINLVEIENHESKNDKIEEFEMDFEDDCIKPAQVINLVDSEDNSKKKLIGSLKRKNSRITSRSVKKQKFNK